MLAVRRGSGLLHFPSALDTKSLSQREFSIVSLPTGISELIGF